MVPLIASLILALATPVSGSPAPSLSPVVAATPSAKPLAPVVINGVLFRAVEFDSGKAIWRNLAITIVSARLAAWQALPAATKSSYAQLMIDTYRAGMNYGRDIKLTFVDDRNATLDQYLWTPPVTERRS
jgi:hypothetical protein